MSTQPKPKTSSKRDWKETEAQIWGQGIAPSDPSAEEQVLIARVREHDLRKAEALCAVENVSGLQAIRTYLARGLHVQARELLQTLLESPESAASAEIWLEKSRLDGYDGRWFECLSSATKALNLNPSGLTQMTLLQIRTVAFFELGQLSSVFADADKIESLATLYPASTGPFFARLLKTRSLHRSGSEKTARDMLNAMWDREFHTRKLDPDRLLALIRAEIDLRRSTVDGNAVPWMWAALSVAEHLGDSFYAALARLDLSSARALGDHWKMALEEDARNYPRIQRLINEAASAESAVSSSAQSLRTTAAAGTENTGDTSSLSTHLIFAKRLQSIRIDKFGLQSMQRSPKMIEAITALNGTSMTKPDFFAKLWGSQKYVPHLHDSLIHQLVFRLRKGLGINVRFENERFHLGGVLVLG